jgi:phosphotransferase system  glucose/maltose/N-acetylglucosamine-specific IIC component
MNLVQCIKGSRSAFIILLGILVIACILMGLTSALGDRLLVQVFKGIALMSAVCWLINFVTLVMFLAQSQLQALEAETEEEE